MIPGGLQAMMMATAAVTPRNLRSLRLRAAAQASLSRTPQEAGNRRIFTCSVLLKRGALGRFQGLLCGPQSSFGFTDTDTFFYHYAGQGIMHSRAQFRDPGAHMHVVFAYDATCVQQADRLQLFVNHAPIPFASSFIAQDAEAEINDAVETAIGYTDASGSMEYADMLLSELHLVDGQALSPAAFASFDGASGIWIPTAYAGDYGSNGFYLPFSDNSAATATTLGKDHSGNDNDWTPANISVAEGPSNDSLVDVAINYADGRTGRGNYACLNPLSAQATLQLSDANLRVSGIGIAATCTATMPVDTGRRYMELSLFAFDGAAGFGFTSNAMEQSGLDATAGKYWVVDDGLFRIVSGQLESHFPGRMETGQVWQLAMDGEAGKAWIGVNNVWLDASNGATGAPATGANPTFTYPAGTTQWPMLLQSAGSTSINFGQTPFQYAPPPGFLAINTHNLPQPAVRLPQQYMDIRLRAGTGEPGEVTDLAYAPGLVWSKSRNVGSSHVLYDTARGAGLGLSPTDYIWEAQDDNSLSRFTDHGYAFGSNAAPDYFNFNQRGQAYVDWSWAQGTIPGFDIVLYTGGLEPGATIAHGLGAVPAVVATRARNAGGEWTLFHQALPPRYTLYWSLPIAASDYLDRYDPPGFTASVFKLGSDTENNDPGVTQVAYLWAEVAGFSRFASYVGNGQHDGPFVWCGFRPRLVITKSIDSFGSWNMHDTARDPYNLAVWNLQPNTGQMERNYSHHVDLLSNGFKLRTTEPEINGKEVRFAFMAFAESPFKYARAR